VYELVNGHKAATNAHNQLIIHDFSVYFPGSELIEPATHPRNRQLNPLCINILRKHLIDNVALNSVISLPRGIILLNIDHFGLEVAECALLTLKLHR